MAPDTNSLEIELTFGSEEASKDLARLISPFLDPGDCVLFYGPIGAGKSTLAREILQSRMAAAGSVEDVPSPTYTIVQYYDVDGIQFLHCDLYRLGDISEIDELGISEAFDTSVCLVEWADRLEDLAPESALKIRLTYGAGSDQRNVKLTLPQSRWRELTLKIKDSVDD